MNKGLSEAYLSQKQRVFEKDQMIQRMLDSGELVADIELGTVTGREGKKLPTSICPNGYCRVYLNDTLFFRLHRVIALAASGLQPDWMLEISHRDHCKLNNGHRNLQWVTRSENIKRSVQAGRFPQATAGKGRVLNQSEEQLAKRLYAEGWTYGQIARHFGIHRRTAKFWVEHEADGYSKSSRPYTCISPTGERFTGRNLAEFCRLMGISYETMRFSRARNGKASRSGWRCLPLNPQGAKGNA